jgi:uncharacterized repeat protein (TIGR01451 family)
VALAPATANAQIADLVLTKTDFPDPVDTGNELDYRLALFNAGPGVATGVSVSDPLPAGTEFVAASPTCSHAAGVVTCTAPGVPPVVPAGSITPLSSTGFDVHVRVTQPGVVTNTATVSQSSVETDPSDNVSTVSTTVGTSAPPTPLPPLAQSTCKGRPATIVDKAGDKNGKIKGTFERDVIVGLGGNDRISGGGGPDLICGGSGGDLIQGGRGEDKLLGNRGRDGLRGGAAEDDCRGGPGKDFTFHC